MKKILELDKVNVSFPQGWGPAKPILKDVSFSVLEGGVTGFVGVNGSGKTTSIKTILGFLQPASGRVLFFQDQQLSSEAKKKIGFLPERPYFYEFLTGEEFLRLHWDLHRGTVLSSKDFAARCDDILRAVDLERGKKMRLRQYSKGMLQRIGIAQALLMRPDFLILDEPMSGLDPDGRRLIKNILAEVANRGTTVFFSSHLLEDMEELCERVVIIDQGRVLFDGAMGQLLNSSGGDVSIRFEANGQVQTMRCAFSQLQSQIDLLRNQSFSILEIVPHRIRLEEAFKLLRDSGRDSGRDEVQL